MRVDLCNSNALNIPLADNSCHMVCTSPPYYSLRNYNIEGQLGLEPTLQEYIDNTVKWCAEVWRVLRDDGVFWLNLGDTYASSWSSGRRNKIGNPSRTNRIDRLSNEPLPLKEKDLMLVPHRVAIALQEAGWWVRSDIVWAKPNPMPESVTDRPTKAHEYIFLLTKNKNYYYDADAIREGYNSNDGSTSKISGFRQGNHSSKGKERTEFYNNSGRNKRTVWTIITKAYSAKTQTYHLRRVGQDAVSDGMTHIMLPSCRVHGDQFVQVAKEFCGEHEADWMSRIERTCACLFQELGGDFSQVSESKARWVSKEGWLPLRYSPTAIDHNNHSHKMALSLGSKIAYIPFFENLSRIVDKRELLVSFVQHLCIYGNSILKDDFSAHLLQYIPHRIVDKSFELALKASDTPKCSCLFYEHYTRKLDHFAAFPPEIPETCIKAGTSEKGVCPVCGNQWERVVDRELVPTKKAVKTAVYDDRDKIGHSNNDQGSNRQRDGHKPGYITAVNTVGFRPTCSHYDEQYKTEFPQARKSRKRHQQGVGGYWWKRVRERPGKEHWVVSPATVLDNFGGSGTTALVANQLGRHGISLDLSWEYLQLAKKRTGITGLQEWEGGRKAEPNLEGLPMFET